MKITEAIKNAVKSFSINKEQLPKTKLLFVRESSYWTKQSNGFMFEEYSERFKSKYERQQIFMRMDNDWQVFQMRNAITLMKTSTNFFVDPFSEDGKEPTPEDEDVAKFVEKCLFENLDKWFKWFLEDINLYVRDGFSLFELYFEKKDEWFFPQFTRLASETVFKWRTSKDEPWVQQLTFYPKAKEETDDENLNEGMTTVDIPSNKLILFNINSEWVNYEGRSLYRKIAKDRFFKDKFENYHAVLQERMAIPPLKIKVPQGTEDAQIEEYKNIAENMRSLESGYVTEYLSDDGAPLVWYEWMTTNIWDNANKLTEAIKHYQQNINDIFFQQFLYLWKSEKWSYWMANTSTAFFFEAVKWLLEKDMEVINKYIIPKIVAINFGVVWRCPKIKFWQVGVVDTTQLSTTIASLVSGQILTPNHETEEHIRELLHLPQISEEEYNEKKQSVLDAQNKMKEQESVKKKDNSKIENNKEEKEHSSCWCGNLHFSDESHFDHEKIINHQVEWLMEGDDVWARNFSDPVVDGFWRPLTFAERRVSLKSIKENLDEEEALLLKKYSEIADNMTQKLLDQVKLAVEKNDMVALSELTAKYKTDISLIVTQAYKKMFDYGKNETSRELWFQIPSSKQDLKDVIKIQAENIAEGIVSKVEAETKAIIASQIVKNEWLKNTSSASVVVAVKNVVKPYLDQAAWMVVSIWVNQSFNSWRKSVAYVNAEKLHSAQYSAIIDWRTSNRCLSLDGKVVKLDSPDYKNYSPPQHIRCRSMWVYIRADEQFKPDFTEIPSSIPVKDTLTSKELLKVPVLTKDSPASKQIEKEIQWRRANNANLTGKRKEKNEEIINRLKKSII